MWIFINALEYKANLRYSTGSKARLITYWRHQEKKRAAKPLKKTTAKDSKLDRKKEDVPTEPIKVIESIIADKPAERKIEKTAEKQSQRDEQSLIVENAILKERIALLNGEIEKLRTALTSLM